MNAACILLSGRESESKDKVSCLEASYWSSSLIAVVRDVGPICSWFVQGDDVIVAEHYDVSIICLCWYYPSGATG